MFTAECRLYKEIMPMKAEPVRSKCDNDLQPSQPQYIIKPENKVGAEFKYRKTPGNSD
jgi:hypothetical protein